MGSRHSLTYLRGGSLHYTAPCKGVWWWRRGISNKAQHHLCFMWRTLCWESLSGFSHVGVEHSVQYNQIINSTCSTPIHMLYFTPFLLKVGQGPPQWTMQRHRFKWSTGCWHKAAHGVQTHFIGIHFCAHIVSLTYRSRALIGRNMCSSFPPHVAHLFNLDDVDDDVLGEIELLKHEAKIETTDTTRTK